MAELTKTADPSAETESREEALKRLSRMNTLRSILPLIGLLFVFILFNVLTGGRMIRNLPLVLSQVYVVMIASMGVFFIMTMGGLDFSQGSILGLSSIVICALSKTSIPLAVLGGIVTGAAIGAFNGYFYVFRKIKSFIVTICSMFLFRGLIKYLTTNAPVAGSAKLINFDTTALKFTCTLVVLAIGFFAFRLARLGIPHATAAGYYQHETVLAQIRRFAQVAKAIALSKRTMVATFGNNMRDVAVTDGNRLECEIKYGWEIKYFGIGDLAKLAAEAAEAEVDAKMAEYESKYTMATDNVEAVREQARYEIGMEKFMAKRGATAFTDNFQDLYGLKQLPGLAVQNLMTKGVGFGPEGDYKISALSAVLMKMAEGREGATGFIEDYTYDLTPGAELELASHMLEVPPSFAATKPEIQVHPLDIGGRADPARLVFDGTTGDGIQVTLIDMGDHFRLICADIELVKQPAPMPKLPVARIMYRHKPNFAIGTAAWCYAGGAHHSVVSTALTRQDIALFARLTGTELVVIGDDTTEADLQRF